MSQFTSPFPIHHTLNYCKTHFEIQ